MQRKPGFPAAICNIKMPDSMSVPDPTAVEEDGEHRQQQFINFGHAQWGFNNWSWTVSKQDLDFVDYTNGKYCAGVAAFVAVSVKSLDIRRENVGYATSLAATKGLAIHQARKCSVTNGLRETLISFGGEVAAELKATLVSHTCVPPEPQPQENNQNVANKPPPLVLNNEHKHVHMNNNFVRRDAPDAVRLETPAAPCLGTGPSLPPQRAAPRPPSNVSFVLQPVMPPLYAPAPRVPPPHMFPNCYAEYAAPWHFAYDGYDRHHGNVNLNFNIPPKNLLVNSRAGTVECKNAYPRGGMHEEMYPSQPQDQSCWVKPTIFYDGFWTEQKVKKWVAEQVEKQFPEDNYRKPAPRTNGQPDHR